MRSFFLAVASASVVAACAAPAPAPPAAAATDSAAVRAALEPYGVSYKAAVLAGDAAAVGALYTENAVVELSDTPTLVGRAAIMKNDSTTMAAVKFTDWNAPVNSTADFGGGRAAQTGTFAAMLADKKGAKMAQAGRWVAGFMKGDDGQWRINYLMAMTDSMKPVK